MEDWAKTFSPLHYGLYETREGDPNSVLIDTLVCQSTQNIVDR